MIVRKQRLFFILVKRYAFIFAYNAVFFGRQNGRHKGECMQRLYELRTEKVLSQRGMAANFNVSQGTYNNWENGRTQPSVEQLVALANFFGVSVDYLVSNDEVRNDIKDSLTEEQRKLFRAVSQLDVRSASLLADFLESLLK